MPKIKKITPTLKSDFLIFRAFFRVWGNPKNQNELNLNSFLYKFIHWLCHILCKLEVRRRILG